MYVRAVCCSLESDMSSITIGVLHPRYILMMCSSIVFRWFAGTFSPMTSLSNNR